MDEENIKAINFCVANKKLIQLTMIDNYGILFACFIFFSSILKSFTKDFLDSILMDDNSSNILVLLTIYNSCKTLESINIYDNFSEHIDDEGLENEILKLLRENKI